MHEMSIAESLMEQILDIAQANNMQKVAEVELDAGYLRQVIPEVMQEAFLAVTEGTIADGATLTINEIAPLAVCRKCKDEFMPQLDDFLCPQCRQADVDILKGDEIILKSLVGN
jgi:hydrogenase nickel incorporation protein HypA/HybF